MCIGGGAGRGGGTEGGGVTLKQMMDAMPPSQVHLTLLAPYTAPYFLQSASLQASHCCAVLPIVVLYFLLLCCAVLSTPVLRFP